MVIHACLQNQSGAVLLEHCSFSSVFRSSPIVLAYFVVQYLEGYELVLNSGLCLLISWHELNKKAYDCREILKLFKM